MLGKKASVGSTLAIALLLLGATVTAATCRDGLADSPWPMFHHDLQHTGRSPYRGPVWPGVKWYYTTGGAVASSPAIASDGTLYVGSRDDNLYAINPDGTLKWRYTTEGDVDSSPAIASDGTIYVGSRDGYLYAINSDGTLKWRCAAEGGIGGSSPAIAPDGTIYVGSRGDTATGWYGRLYAINPDGTPKWEYIADYGVESSPAIASDGTVYIGSWHGTLYAVNPDGTLKWSYWIAEMSCSPAIASDGTIYVGSTYMITELYAINPDGTLKWSYDTGEIGSSPAIGSDGAIYVGSSDRKLCAINPDGTLKWRYTTGGSIHSSPAIDSDGTIYVGSQDNALYAVNPDGTLKWRYDTEGSIWSSPAIGSDETIYVGSHDARLYAIGKAGPPKPPCVTINDGALFTSSTEVALTLIPPKDTMWMMISNDGGFVGAEWVSFASSVSWTITSHGDYRIPRIVYVAFRDSQGILYGPYTDDIIYDPIPPTGSVSIVGTGDTVTLYLEASDDNSGVGEMIISNSESFEGAIWEAYAPTKQWTLDANRTVYVRYKDRAGNVSEAYSATQYRVYLPFVMKSYVGGLR